MVDTTIWLLVALGVLVATLLVWYFVSRKSGCGFDYYSMFVIGVIWAPVGFALRMYWLGIIGSIFLIWGLVHKSAWRKRCMWVDLSGADKWVRIVVIVVLTLLLAAGVYFILKGGGILNG